MFFDQKSMEMVTADKALPGRAEPLPTAEVHFLSGLPLKSPVPHALMQARAKVLMDRTDQALLRLQGLPAGPVRALTAVLSAETLIWIAFWRSARSRTIQWRGHPFRVESGGRLRPASTPPS